MENTPSLSVYSHLLHNNLADGLLAIQQQYGDYVQLPRANVLFVSDPLIIQHVVQGNWRNYGKSATLKKARVLLGTGLLTNEGASWRQQRRLMAPAFHRRQIAGLADTMVACTDAMLQRWERYAQRDELLDVSAEFNTLTMEIATKTLFSATISAQESATVSDALDLLLDRFQSRALLPFGFLDRLPLPSNRVAARALGQLDSIVYRIVQERRRSGAEHNDLLAMLMDAQDEETGLGMSDQQMRDEVMTLFLAGYETTASHLAWTTLLLSQHPSVRRDIRPKIRQAFKNNKPNVADLMAIPALRHVIDESLRRYPPVWIFGRVAQQDEMVKGIAIKAGTTVLMSPYVMHNHAAYWDNPQRFLPARFADDAAKSRPPFAYWPFGGGPRLCIGNQFALMESTIVLAMMLERFNVDVVPEQRVALRPSLTIRPKFNLWARVGRK